MKIAPRISVDEKVCFGKPVIAGTRIPVELILGKLAGGMSYEEVIKEYEITHEDILAALDYASKVLSGEEIKSELQDWNNEREDKTLSEFATKSIDGQREKDEREESEVSEVRGKFARDADRIIHSQAYSRYIDKTQVFYLFENDHITHRVLHVQLVSKIARTIGRALKLNEDLIEAIALGHDIGHTAYGHEGEQYLSKICKGRKIGEFHHSAQGVIFLSRIEKGGKGLNLTLQVLDGILCHDGEAHDEKLEPKKDKTWDTHYREIENKKKGKKYEFVPMTLEGCVVRFSDTISYIGRDIQDAKTVNLLVDDRDLPISCRRNLGTENRTIVDELVKDVIKNSYQKKYISYSKEMWKTLKKLKGFNYKMIYKNLVIKTESEKIEKMFQFLFNSFLEDLEKNNRDSRIFKDFIDKMDDEYRRNRKDPEIVKDFIAGMTDRYFNNCFKEKYFPQNFGYSIKRQ